MGSKIVLFTNLGTLPHKKVLYIQPLNFAYIQLLNKPYEKEVTLTGQNPPLKYCQHLEIQYTVRKKVDLLMLKILGL